MKLFVLCIQALLNFNFSPKVACFLFILLERDVTMSVSFKCGDQLAATSQQTSPLVAPAAAAAPVGAFVTRIRIQRR